MAWKWLPAHKRQAFPALPIFAAMQQCIVAMQQF
jgi:hypothetical protein